MADQLGMTVGQLRAALDGLPDDMNVTVRTEDTEGNCFCGGIIAASREEHHHDGEPDFFAIDCSDDEEELADPRGAAALRAP